MYTYTLIHIYPYTCIMVRMYMYRVYMYVHVSQYDRPIAHSVESDEVRLFSGVLPSPLNFMNPIGVALTHPQAI